MNAPVEAQASGANRPQNRARDLRRLRTAVIGAGITGRNHAAVIADYHRSELVAVCSRQPAAAAALAEKYAAPHVFTDYRELLRLPELEAVIIATPDFAHHDLAVAPAPARKPRAFRKS